MSSMSTTDAPHEFVPYFNSSDRCAYGYVPPDIHPGCGQPRDAAIHRASTPAEIDFSCRVCGVACAIAPDPPARAICPDHCEDHDYQHDPSRAAKFCQHCDQEEPIDWR